MTQKTPLLPAGYLKMAQHVLPTPLYCLSNTSATWSGTGFKPFPDIENTTSPAKAIRHLFRLLQAFDTPRDNQPVCPSFRTLLAWSPPAPVMNGANRSRVAGSHVMRQGWCLARWLHPSNYLEFSSSPERVFGGPRFQNGSLTVERLQYHRLGRPEAGYAHHTPKASSSDA